MSVKRGNLDEEDHVSTLSQTKRTVQSAGRLPVETAWLRVRQCRFADAVPVHSRMGVGCVGRCDAGVRRMGAYINMQEVKKMRVRMVCIRVPRFMSGFVRMLAGKRRA